MKYQNSRSSCLKVIANVIVLLHPFMHIDQKQKHSESLIPESIKKNQIELSYPEIILQFDS